MDTPTKTFGSFAGIMTMLQVNAAHVDYSTSVKQMLRGKKFRAVSHKRAHTGRRFSKFGYDFISKKRYNNEEYLKSKGLTSLDIGTYKINEPEAKIVRIIFEEYVKGKSGQLIANLLNDRGLKTKLGKKWQSAPIIRMIQDDIYKGEAKANFNWNAGEEPIFEQFDLGKDFAPQIVTKTLWNQAAAIHGKKFKVVSSRKFLLSDFLVCGLCEGNISIRLAAGKYIKCHCNNHDKAAYRKYCELKDFNHETIAPAVWNKVMTVLIDSRSVIRAMEQTKTDLTPVLKRELAELEELLKEIPKQKKRIRESFIRFGEDINSSEIEKQYKDLSAEESRIHHRIQEINSMLIEAKKIEIAGIEIEEWMTDIHSFLNKAEDEKALLEKQRYVLSQLNIKVIIHKRNEDGTVDFEITGILPKEVESDIQEISESVFSNSKVDSNYPTIEQTSA
jgi:site-specific DNA recombinase